MYVFASIEKTLILLTTCYHFAVHLITCFKSWLCCFVFQEHSGRVFRLQFDQFQIVSSSHDDTILIWDFLDAETEEENKTQPNRTYTYVTRWASWHTTIPELASETNNWGANVSIISKYNNHFFSTQPFCLLEIRKLEQGFWVDLFYTTHTLSNFVNQTKYTSIVYTWQLISFLSHCRVL